MSPLINAEPSGINDIMPTFSAKAGSPSPRVLHLICPGTKLLDIAGPLQVFHDAKRPDGRRAYRPIMCSFEGGPVTTDVGFDFETCGIASLRVQSQDALLVPGGPGIFAAAKEQKLVRWFQTHAPKARIVASTCTGAFLLAAAGLLDGRRAVTHWDDCDALQESHPDIVVEEDPIFIEDGNVWTSAGVTAGIDLALAIVERDLGRTRALDLARRLVVHSKRSGGQSQFSTRLRQQVESENGLYDELHDWVARNLAADLRVEQLADRVAQSPRTFHRAYTKEIGETPARMVTRLRVEAAHQRLEETQDSVATIATTCGFGTEEHLRRSFQRELGLSPSAYRNRWSV